MIGAILAGEAREIVSMESGLEDRNNRRGAYVVWRPDSGLNGVRPRRPEQCEKGIECLPNELGLNGVRPRRPEQCIGRYMATILDEGLNGVRPRRPEQLPIQIHCTWSQR